MFDRLNHYATFSKSAIAKSLYHILKVSDYDGVPRLKLAYYLSVELFGKSHSLESVVGIEGETFMLGKDLLGDHSLLLLLPAG